MTETQLRFLRAIAERIPLDRLAEVYVFPPMKQGIVETGIAIVAAEREGLSAAPGDVPAGDASHADATASMDAEACDPTEDASRDPVASAAAAEVAESAAPARVPDAPASPPHTPGYVAPNRHTVYTARYRLTLKGPERGKWELNVVEEADAPLLTVEVVVRGVQHRSGEGADPERLEPAALRALLAPASAAPAA